MSFSVAIIGRPNVGKSTLFNRLTRSKQALVNDIPGLTRDRKYGAASLGEFEFDIIDTAGLESETEHGLESEMMAQTYQAIEQADIVWILLDGRAGILPLDREFIALFRKKQKPHLLIINKGENESATLECKHEAYGLGLGEPVLISAEHGLGISDLEDGLEHWIAKSGVSTTTDAVTGNSAAVLAADNISLAQYLLPATEGSVYTATIWSKPF